MKTKIFNQLKQDYAHLGLSDEVLQGRANALAGFATDDNLIDIVKGQKEDLEGLQKELDKRASQAVETYKKKNPTVEPPKPNDPPTPSDPPKDDTPAWAKALIDKQEKLEQSLTTMQTGSLTKSRNEKLEAVLKDLPKEFADSARESFGLFGENVDDEKFNTWIGSVETRGRELSAKANTYVPGSGQFPKGEPSDSEIGEIAKEIL